VFVCVLLVSCMSYCSHGSRWVWSIMVCGVGGTPRGWGFGGTMFQ
jgi:hypothetical protein